MELAGYRFDVICADIAEIVPENAQPHEVVMSLALQKAQAMLRALSGRSHKVYTGVAIICCGKVKNFFDETDVEFYPLSDGEIREYVATGEPMDKAGAYGIQGRGSVLVKKINGDFFNVMGLPIAKVYREMTDYV